MSTPMHLRLAPEHLALRLGDRVHDGDGTLLGSIDRAVVTPDLHTVTHLGVQPVHHFQWPRLVAVDELQRSAPEDEADATLVLRSDRTWPDGFPTADVIPGVPQEEWPDHPIQPTSGLARFLLSFTSNAAEGPLSISAAMRDRVPAGETTLRGGAHLVESDRYAIGQLGEVVGVVAVGGTGEVVDVLVSHRHGLHHRVARLPVAEVTQAGVGQVTTGVTRDQLDTYDVTA